MSRRGAELEPVALGPIAFGEWARLVAGEPSPFGSAAAGVQFRPKDRNVGIRDERGTLVAVGGCTLVEVSVAAARFPVVGFGGLIVHRDWRGRRLGETIMDRVEADAAGLGPARGLVFCEPHLLAPYARRGFTRLTQPVVVDQPDGEITLPLEAMWRPLHPSTWPDGPVRVHGLPF